MWVSRGVLVATDNPPGVKGKKGGSKVGGFVQGSEDGEPRPLDVPRVKKGVLDGRICGVPQGFLFWERSQNMIRDINEKLGLITGGGGGA